MAKDKKQTAKTEQRYRLVRDEDSHWYMIPADKREEFDRWVESTCNWEDDHYEGEDFNKYSLGGSPSNITFTNPKTEK